MLFEHSSHSHANGIIAKQLKQRFQAKINLFSLSGNLVLMAVLASIKVIKKFKKIRHEIDVHRKFLINTGSVRLLVSILSIKSELFCRALGASGVI